MKLRAATTGDLDFVAATLQRSIIRTPRALISKFAAQCITNGSALIACHADEPDVAFGFLLHTTDAVHFIYVKPAFRKFRIAQAMWQHAFADAPKYYTLQSQEFPKELAKKYALKYAPIAGMI